jgi:hypothetical protein
VPRPQGPFCDVGAFEVIPPGSSTPQPSTSPPGSSPFTPGSLPVFDLVSKKVRKKGKKRWEIVLDLFAPSAGDFEVDATFNQPGSFRIAKTRTYGKGSAHASGPGHVRVTLKPTKAARKVLKKTTRRLPVAVRVRFRPVGGTASTKDARVKVRGGRHR